MIHHHPISARWSRTDIPVDCSSPRACSRTIVVADADRDLREIYQIVLRYYGYRVVEATDGVEVLKIVRDLQPDAALLDINLPRLNGLETTRLLRREPFAADTSVILLSIYSDPRVHRRALEAGCSGYLTKPFGSQELLGEVRRVLGEDVELRESA